MLLPRYRPCPGALYRTRDGRAVPYATVRVTPTTATTPIRDAPGHRATLIAIDPTTLAATIGYWLPAHGAMPGRVCVAPGTMVRAARSGKIVEVTCTIAGIRISIEHRHGYTTIYEGLVETRFPVDQGGTYHVSVGHQIGFIGAADAERPQPLRFTVLCAENRRRARSIDPMTFLSMPRITDTRTHEEPFVEAAELAA